jgi:hypothetical protein
LRAYWNVETANLSMAGNYGWGFVKLEPLFGPPGEKFLVLDSDTVLAGPVLDVWNDSQAPFLVNDEKQSEADTKRLYYDWERAHAVDPCAQPPHFVFNSGQWFGTAGVLSRSDFAPWIEWTMPRRLRHPEVFMPGEQGILNYVLNQKVALESLQVEPREIMRWPAHSMDGLDAQRVASRAAAPLIAHWAGLKKARLKDMAGADLLFFFEKQYYRRFTSPEARRVLAACRESLSCRAFDLKVWVSLAARRLSDLSRRTVSA